MDNMDKNSSYQAALQNLRPLQSHCDAVEKDKDQDHIVKELMGNNGLAEQSEPDKSETETEEQGKVRVNKKDKIKIVQLFVLIC